MQALKDELSGGFRAIMSHKLLLVLAIIVAGIGGFFAISQAITVDRAHQTFDNYYAFRGCAQLIEKTDTYGICKTTSGDTIKIVIYNNRWYLDGDLPVCWQGICF